MLQYKLIAVDLDDTLLNDKLEISKRNKKALKNAAQQGAFITIATGRMYRSALPYALSLGIEVPIITYQGALVKNARSGEVLVNNPVPLPLAQEVLKEGYKARLHINVYINDTLFVDSITTEGLGYAKLAKVELNPVGNLLDFLGEEPSKILFIGEPGKLSDLYKELNLKFRDKLYVTKSKPNYLEFMNVSATKGHALQTLANLLKIDRQNIIAFGDSYNDLTMIKYAGKGVAMANAPGEVRFHADCITGSNNEDGVAQVLEKIFS